MAAYAAVHLGKRERQETSEKRVRGFLDGNKSNLEPDNLMAIKRSELARVNQNHRITDDPELTRAGINVERVKEIIRGKS